MAFCARHTLLRSFDLPNVTIPRPGRRALSLNLGTALLLLMVDAVLHPGGIADLWTTRAVERLTGTQAAIVACTIAFAVVIAVAARRRSWRTAEVAP